MKSPNVKKEAKFFIVVGASAGGINALSELVSQLKPGLNAALMIVLHLSRKGISDFLVHKLQQFTALQCRLAADNEPILEDHIYIASPNYHLLVKEGRLLIGHGPVENRWRPSIDVLFRSAAANHNAYVIGIILTGLLDDGSAGMQAIKKSGGICMVQDPNEAEYPDMPLAVLDSMEVDYCVSLAEMGAILSHLTSRSEVNEVEVPAEIKMEAEIAEKVSIGISHVEALGEHSVYSCPDCGGGLWQIKDNNIERYRCYIGHSYSQHDLIIRQNEQMEATLWMALRMFEERRNLLKKMQQDTQERGFTRIASDHADRARDLETHIARLKEMLYDIQNTQETS